jgi:hypothetical protein
MPPKKGKKPEKQHQHQGGDDGDAAEPSRAVLALHPSGRAAAVAVGREVRAWDARTGQLHVLMDASAEGAAEIRHVAFSRCGRFVAAGGDDKTARVWHADGDWAPLLSFRGPKKINLVNFSADGDAVFAANKFGDILVAATQGMPEGPAPFQVLLGHYCSMLTSMSLSSDGRLLATTDRDNKLRVSVMPVTGAAATRGAPDIQSYCLGHTDFVSCSAFVQSGDKELVVSGSADGTLRLWDPLDGRQLGAPLVLTPEGQQRAVLAVCPSQDGTTLVVAMDEEAEVRLVGVDAAAGALTELGRTAVPGLPLVTDVARDVNGTFVFAGGPLPDKTEAVLLAVAELKEGKLTVATSGALGDDAARRQLQRCDESEVGDVAPRRSLPFYLHKRPFLNYEERNKGRKRAKMEEGEAAEGEGAAEAAVAQD